jgi:hypothetical protein
VAIIDPEGLFGGDRLRHCSNGAQLHWPRLFLASDGFARLEINYARIVGRAYPTFHPIPSELELQSYIQEYEQNFLLFLYEADGRFWGQWDTRSELLPRYKTAADRRSPSPPEPAFSTWKRRYRSHNKGFPKPFGEISVNLQHGVGGGKNICASGDEPFSESCLSIDDPPFETTEPDALFPVESALAKPAPPRNRSEGVTREQESRFEEWWSEYWRHTAKKAARVAFSKHVRTEARFQQIMAATRAQRPGMVAREEHHRPHGATWLNGERWEDETNETRKATADDDYREFD